MDESTRRLLVTIARQSLVQYVVSAHQYEPPLADMPEVLQCPGASFVTLNLDGELRGCVGSVEACFPLAIDVARNAVLAATEDPRFPAVTCAELERIHLSVTVLAPLQPVLYAGATELEHKLRPGVDGVLVTWQTRRSLLLPQVWERIEEPRDFLLALTHKAGIPGREWAAQPPTIGVYTFTAESCSEDD